MLYNEYRASANAGRVCLELSLKPFGLDLTPEGIEKTVRHLFEQWMPLLRRATGCSVLFWTSDGSEILEYTGRLEDKFQWCQYIGIGNWDRNKPPEEDPNARSFHHYPILYREDPPEMTYGDLKNIITTLKRVGKELTGLDVEAGETFDPGPEFAYSAFKYERHTEICQGNIMGTQKWLHCASTLHAEDHAYAAYPDGIPEGTHLGTFLGKQFMAMKKDIGFDYIWLSNGFGYSLASWNWTGELFDGTKFDFAGAQRVRDNIAAFWDHFTAEVKDVRIETRGSNISTGMDIAAHGCPIDVIYQQKGLLAPPNSPWACMNYRFGLMLAGFMSHIAALPDQGFLFRYYIHDPWWLNSPWFDRYDRSPHDIYLVLSIARLAADGTVTRPFGMNFLSADDSHGHLPDRCPNEVIPHILTAFNDYPDAAGPLTWVYPFNGYCDLGLKQGKMERLFMDDWFIESAIDKGLPLNSVISDENFIKADKGMFRVLVTPVPEADSDMEKALFAAMDAGAKVLLYGSLKYASAGLLELLGVTYGSEIDGELAIRTSLPLDTAEVGTYSDILLHDSLVSGGGIGEICEDGEVLAAVSAGDEKRAYAIRGQSGSLIWIRGSFPHNAKTREGLPPLWPASRYFPPALLMRAALTLFGWKLRFDCYDIDDNLPIVHLAKCRNGLWMNEFSKDATVRMYLSTPEGAPLFDNGECIVENSEAMYATSRWLHMESRMFVKQEARSKITVKKDSMETYVRADELFKVTGLKDATLYFYPAKGGIAEFRTLGRQMFQEPDVPSCWDEERGCYVAEHVTGGISVIWQEKEHIDDYKKLDFLGVNDHYTW